MKPLFTILSLFIVLISFCQDPTIEWEKSYGGSGSDVANNVYLTSDGGSIVAGYTSSNDGDVTGLHGDSDYWVVKLNAQGNIMWEKALGGSGKDVAYSIRQTNDGGYIVAGSTNSNDGDVSGYHVANGVPDAWVVKLDASGNIQWQRCYGGIGTEEAYCVRQTTDGGYILACTANRRNGDVSSIHGSTTQPFHSDYWIVKLNADGSIKWNKSYGGSENEKVACIEQTLDKGYVMAGYAESTDGDVEGPDVETGWIVKIDSAGTIKWKDFAGSDEFTDVSNVKQAEDSNYIVVGAGYGDGYSQNFFEKFDKNGNEIWTHYLPNPDYFAGLTDLQVRKNDYIITHQAYYYMYKYDTSGTLLWSTPLETIFPISLDCAENNGCIIAGADQAPYSTLMTNFRVLKFGNDGILPVTFLNFAAHKQNNTTLLQWQTANELNNSYFNIERSPDSKLFTSISNKPATNKVSKSNYAYVDNAPLTGTNYYRLKQVDKDGKFTYSNIVSVDFSNKAATFAVYPNPANNSLNITFPVSNNASQIILFEANGRKIMNEQLASNVSSKQLNINRLPAGIYNVVLIQGSKQQTIKLVKK